MPETKETFRKRLFAPGGKPLSEIAAGAEETLERSSAKIGVHLKGELSRLEAETSRLSNAPKVSRDELLALSESVSALLGLAGMARETALCEGLKSLSCLVESVLEHEEAQWPSHALFAAALAAHSQYCRKIQTHSEEANDTAQEVLDHLERMNAKILGAL
ncbi:MAG: hypothetical protein Tsb0010_12910 [Parvularculaceae bacterium]